MASQATKERNRSDRGGSSRGKQNGSGDSGGGLLAGVRNLAENNPATQRLLDEAGGFVQAKGRHLMSGLTDKVGDLAQHLDDFSESGGSSPLLKGAGKLAEGKSPVTAALSAGMSGLKDKVKDAFGKGGSGDSTKATSITEQVDVGAPRSVVYNQWTQFTEFQKFAKGVKSADQQDETHVKWRAKIFWSTRSWDAEITEQIPDKRIAWKSSGDKGTVDGAVTFHELTPDLTRVILQLEYHPAGLFERTGNLWRAQGRRTRLDLKHFRRFVMMRGEETGAWRGEIQDGDVVSQDDGGGEQGQDREGRSRGDRKSRSEGRSRSEDTSGDDGKSRSEGRSRSESRSRDDRKPRSEGRSRPQGTSRSEGTSDSESRPKRRAESKGSTRGSKSGTRGSGSENGEGGRGSARSSARKRATARG